MTLVSMVHVIDFMSNYASIVLAGASMHKGGQTYLSMYVSSRVGNDSGKQTTVQLTFRVQMEIVAGESLPGVEVCLSRSTTHIQ